MEAMMPTLDEIRAKNAETADCKHENWEEYFSGVISPVPSHNASGRCTGCGKTCREVYPTATRESCEVCKYFKAVRA